MLRGRQFAAGISPELQSCPFLSSKCSSRNTLKGKLPRSKLTVPKLLSPGHSMGFDLKPKPESPQKFFEETLSQAGPKTFVFAPFASLRIFSPERFQRRIQ